MAATSNPRETHSMISVKLIVASLSTTCVADG